MSAIEVAQPWERLSGETEPAWQAFCTFRDVGPGRTLAGVAAELSKSRQLVARWAGRWRWRERAAAFDSAGVRAAVEAKGGAQREAIEEHRRAARHLRAMAEKMLTPPPDLPEGVRPEDWRPTPATAQAAGQVLDKAIHHERLALGLPTDITRQDIVTREKLAEATEVNRALILLLQEHLCDDCRERIIPELERLIRRHEATEAAL